MRPPARRFTQIYADFTADFAEIPLFSASRILYVLRPDGGGDREGGGEIVKMGNGKIFKWPNGKITRWQDGKMKMNQMTSQPVVR